MIYLALNAPDPVLDAKIDIGFAVKDTSKVSVKDRLERHKKLYYSKSVGTEENVGESFKQIICSKKCADFLSNLRNKKNFYTSMVYSS